MKNYILTLYTMLYSVATFAQNNIGIGTALPHASAALDISSTTRGLLAPRMTTAQRNAITTPAKGLLVYDTDLNALYDYNGSAWSAVGSSGLTFPYAAAPALPGLAFAISNTGTAIQGTATAAAAYGIFGVNNTASGFGIGGNSISGTGVYGFSSGNGVGLRGVSTGGYALLTSGNLRLTGGNTNPSDGAVLTSMDANGNAVWKPREIAFSVTNPQNAFVTHETSRKIEFATKTYDHGNGFTPFAGTVSAGSSVYTVPVQGLYHFSALVGLQYYTAVYNFKYTNITLLKNGVVIYRKMGILYNPEYNADADLALDLDLKCNVGDKIWIEVYQSNSGSSSVSAAYNGNTSVFSGHLVFAD